MSGPQRRRTCRGHADRAERFSRFLAFILRHHPEEINLELDERASADLDELVEAMHAHGRFTNMNRADIEAFIAEHPPRFAINDGRIRARYGHSLDEPVRYPETEPPGELYHGTTPEAAEMILTEGLGPGRRQYVHLSIDTPAARQVARRRTDDPAILRVDTVCAAKGGVRFHRASPAVWLCDAVPPECITRVE